MEKTAIGDITIDNSYREALGKKILQGEISEICSKLDIEPLDINEYDQTFQNLIDQYLDQLNRNKNVAIAKVAHGRFVSSKTGKWSEKVITSSHLRDIIDWLSNFADCLPQGDVKERFKNAIIILRTMKAPLTSSLRKIAVARNFPKRLPSASQVFEKDPEKIHNQITGNTTQLAFSIFLKLLPRVKSPKTLKSKQGNDAPIRAARATSAILRARGRIISPKTILKAYREYTVSLPKSPP